ncbi:MAG: XdhC family protein [Rhodocyclaceae bacterium]|nr:XdhC family protein [Rhodocyclaceae bacterium]
MDSMDREVLEAARRWAAEGHRFALVTVVRTWGSAPRPPGAWMLLRADGRVQGSVSGGCIEDDLIARMSAGEFGGSAPQVLRYGVTRDEAFRFGLPCGGTLELLLEPAPALADLEAMHQRIAAGELVERAVDVATGAVHLAGGRAGSPLSWDGARLVTQHGPCWRLLLIGAGQISRYLAPIARSLGFEVQVCDPRVEYSEEWRLPEAPLVPGMPDDVVTAMAPDPRTAIVALTHDPRLDDMALLEALKSAAFYVGALGSKANSRKRRERLLEYFDLSAEEVGRLRGPVGLPIGSRTPPEIAVAVAAELVAARSAQLGALSAASTAPSDVACGVG